MRNRIFTLTATAEPRKNHLLLLVFALTFLANTLTNTPTQAGPLNSAQIPLKEIARPPANDLIHQSRRISPDQAVQLHREGIDLSTLNPQETDLWQNQKLSAVEYPDLPFPAEGGRVHIKEQIDGSPSLVQTLASLPDGSQDFRLTVSIDLHAALARAALLRKLGFPIPSPKRYKKLTLVFANADAKEKFISDVETKTGTVLSWWQFDKTATEASPLEVTLKEIVLEPPLIEVTPYHWASLPYQDERNPNPTDGRRTVRSLVVPLSLLNIPESVNKYTFEVAKRFNGYVIFYTPAGGTFSDTTIADVRWMAKKIEKLKRDDWEEIIAAGQYPDDVGRLLLEKTIGRRTQLMKVLRVRQEPLPYTRTITIGSVVNGKLGQEFYEGYVPRFSYGDPQNPLRLEEIGRLLGIQAISSAIASALGKADDYINYFSADHWIKEYQKKSEQEFLDAITKNPQQKYIQPIKIFGGPTLGANIATSRSLVTGTYFGSNSQVQLVDQIGASVSVGVFGAVGGIPSVGISANPNATYTRNYVHVRPMVDIKTAWKKKWTDLLVPVLMMRLGKILSKDDADPELGAQIEKFLEEMNPGEMFVVTDSLASGGTLQVTVPLGALLGLGPWANSLSAAVEGGGNYTIMARTTLVRTEDGIQVYIQRAKNGLIQGALSFDFFIRIFRGSIGTSNGTAHNKAFIFNEVPSDVEQKKLFSKAMRAILRKNRSSYLDEYFPKYHLDHSMSAKIRKAILGPAQFSRREEFHKVVLTPPEDPQKRYEPKDHIKTLVEGRITRIRGIDPYGFIGRTINMYIPFISIGGGQQSDDPSGNFLGSSFIQTVHSEADATPGTPDRLTVSMEESHNGWIMGNKRLSRMIEKIEDKVKELVPDGTLLSNDDLEQTRKLQAYSISSKTWIYEKGVERLLKILDANRTSTLNAYNFWVGLENRNELDEYCASKGLKVDAGTLDRMPSPEQQSAGMYFYRENGKNYFLGCLTPWMETALFLRDKVTRSKELTSTEKSELKGKILTLNRLIMQLHRNLPFDILVKWIDTGNLFFNVRVSGFRKNDENGDKEYISSTIGTLENAESMGPFADITDATGIISHELSARYLSDGF